MKRILKINAIVAILFCSVLVFFTYKNNDTDYWNDWGQSAKSQTIYLRNTGYQGDDLYAMLTSIANEKKVNLIKTDYLVINKKTVTVKSVYLHDQTDSLFKDTTLIKGRYLTNSDMDKNVYISTRPDQNKQAVGQMFDLFNDDDVQVWTLSRFKSERGNLDGDYIVRASDVSHIGSFIKELSNRSGISVNDLTSQKTFQASSASAIELSTLLGLIICFLLFALLSVFYAVNNTKRIGVLKLNGYSNFHIWKSMIENIVFIMISAALILDILFLFLVTGMTRDFLLHLVILQLLLLGVFLVLSLLIYLIIKKNTIGNLIKNKKPIKLITSITYIIKNGLLLIMIALVVAVSGVFVDIKKEYKQLSQWKEVGSLALLVNVDVGNDIESFSQGKTTLSTDFAQYYDQLNKEGAIYINVEKFTPHEQFKTKINEKTGEIGYVDYFNPKLVPENYVNNTFYINPNYIKNYPIFDSSGHKIHISENDERTILIPDTMASSKDALLSLYKSDYIQSILSDAGHFHKKISGIPTVKMKAILYKADKKGYFTFNDDYASTDYKVYNPIFVVMPQSSMTEGEKSDIQVSGLPSPLKINLHGEDSSQYNQQIGAKVKKFHLDDNNLKYMTINEIFGTQIESLKKAMIEYVMAVIISFMAMFLLTLQMSQMVLEIKKKKYCIQKLYGYKFIDRFKLILVINIIIELIVSICATFMMTSLINETFSWLSYVVFIPFLCIDIIMTISILHHYENRNLSKMIKGE